MGLWFRSDWVNPFAGYNWIDFAVVHVSGEFDNRFGNIEFHVALLGFHVGGQWKVAAGDLELQGQLDQMLADLESGDVLVSLPAHELDELQRLAAIARESGA